MSDFSLENDNPLELNKDCNGGNQAPKIYTSIPFLHQQQPISF